MRKIHLAAATLLAAPAWAHEGHGLPGAHWHATDVFGWLLAGGLAAFIYWLTRGGK